MGDYSKYVNDNSCHSLSTNLETGTVIGALCTLPYLTLTRILWGDCNFKLQSILKRREKKEGEREKKKESYGMHADKESTTQKTNLPQIKAAKLSGGDLNPGLSGSKTCAPMSLWGTKGP